MVQVKVKKLYKEAKLPKQAKPGDAGFDLYSVENVCLYPESRVVVNTGISIGLPIGYEAQIRPRSGLALKAGVTVLNSPGTVDEGYTGPISVLLINLGTDPVWISEGDRIAQLVVKKVSPIEFIEVDALDITDRGDSGFGSTGA